MKSIAVNDQTVSPRATSRIPFRASDRPGLIEVAHIYPTENIPVHLIVSSDRSFSLELDSNSDTT